MYHLFIGEEHEEARGMESYAGAHPTLDQAQQQALLEMDPDGSSWAQIAKVDGDGSLRVVRVSVQNYTWETQDIEGFGGGTIMGGYVRERFEGYRWADVDEGGDR